MKNQYVIGVDYGTDSVRSVLIDTSNGKEISQSVFYYPRWKAGKYCIPAKNQFRQHPLDYLEGLESTIKDCLAKAPSVNPSSVKGISVDTTGSTPVAVDKSGTPLALTAGFEENPNAMFVLWKDHTSVNEAAEINQVSRTWGGIDYTQFEGGIYSSEWFWAKILHITREDDSIATSAYSWMEHCDWIPAVLIGSDDVDAVKRSRCAAGHKAMWHESWGGLPSEEYLGKFDSRLAALRSRLFEDTYTADVSMGNLCQAWADKLGLTTDTIISVGTFDAHAGAVGVEIESATLVKVMGTSTCDMMVAPFDEIGDKLVRGICGQVDGSIIPGMLGLEAGQSAFGDLLAWFKNLTMWSVQNADIAPEIKQQIEDSIIVSLSKAASSIPISEKNVVALDWVNGRRTPDANQALKGAIIGLGMGSDAPAIFRAMVEAICFGSKAIVDRFKNEGVDIKQIVGMGGVAKKSDFVMQTLADVLDMPVKIATSEQAPALGAAMYAAVAAGIHPDVNTAVSAMGNGFDKTYFPIAENVALYAKLYQKYEALGAFVESQTV
ncbi:MULTISPECIES: ribulokinase [unclassified Arcicella]|uniref:ribulokinase n=1 Tax=unclassified Arcicella TaxID=2644986 RepID=UPI002860EA16|nr:MULTISPECIES: ribulokinase [unclassified Arcicella]MDR6561671.1 L-ribulokinase [Arcicella sp. BE51]MDR6812451.1 L-ribulokinase [Arcicella sp. BE140]MDR6823777.1 L-ribulokinase [Arcicella sp. BE139]